MYVCMWYTHTPQSIKCHLFIVLTVLYIYIFYLYTCLYRVSMQARRHEQKKISWSGLKSSRRGQSWMDLFNRDWWRIYIYIQIYSYIYILYSGHVFEEYTGWIYQMSIYMFAYNISLYLLYLILYILPWSRGENAPVCYPFFPQPKTSIEVWVISRDRPLSQEVAGTWPYISWKMQGAWDQMALPRMDLSTCFYAMFKGWHSAQTR